MERFRPVHAALVLLGASTFLVAQATDPHRELRTAVVARQVMQKVGGGVRINLEDTRLFGLSPDDFPTLIHVLDEHWPAAAVFLDEAQEVSEWQRLVRALLDRGRFVCLTGSNASLLGRELGSKLTGRHRSFEVLPFSYGEYLSCTGRSPGAESLQAFLDEGGFPMAVRARDPQILRELLRDVIQRDIATRHRRRGRRRTGVALVARRGAAAAVNCLTHPPSSLSSAAST